MGLRLREGEEEGDVAWSVNPTTTPPGRELVFSVCPVAVATSTAGFPIEDIYYSNTTQVNRPSNESNYTPTEKWAKQPKNTENFRSVPYKLEGYP